MVISTCKQDPLGEVSRKRITMLLLVRFKSGKDGYAKKKYVVGTCTVNIILQTNITIQ